MSEARDMLRRIETRHKNDEKLARELETKGRLGRFLMLRANPGLADYLKFKGAEESRTSARLSAAQNEADIVLPST